MDSWTWFKATKSLLADFAWHQYWPTSVISLRSLMSSVPFDDSFCRWFSGNLVESDGFIWC